jgi:hypothetical protein
MKQRSLPVSPILRAIVIGAAIAASSSLFAAERAIPGRWEYTMTSEGASRVLTSCMTAEEASQVNGDSSSGRAAAEKKSAGRCTVKSFTATGSAVAYTLVCGSRTISSTTVFHGDSSEGTLTTTVEGKEVVSHVKARRLGACS